MTRLKEAMVCDVFFADDWMLNAVTKSPLKWVSTVDCFPNASHNFGPTVSTKNNSSSSPAHPLEGVSGTSYHCQKGTLKSVN